MSNTLLLLGGTRYAIPVIDAAHDLGCRVVTADYLPGNIAHHYSDCYENVNIADKDAVVECARRVSADGIMSFAADPGVVSAAYAAELLDLPFQGSYEAVRILQNKDLFRNFLSSHGFNCPESYCFSSMGEAMSSAEDLPYPVVVKPTDSAGSKGVSRVGGPAELGAAIEDALAFSLSGKVIVEQFIEKSLPSSDADGFTVGGRFKCVSFTSQLFDSTAANPYTPAAYSMPAALSGTNSEKIVQELQRLSDLLELRDGIYNIETRIGADGLPYIMEVSPRGGGNRLAEMLRYASNVDLIHAAVQASLGLRVEGVWQPRYSGFWYQEIVHASVDGLFRGFEFAPGFESRHLVEKQLWIDAGTHVKPFSAANFAFGSLFFKFEKQEQFDAFLKNKNAFFRTIVE